MRHIISATALSNGARLAMCGHLFDSFDSAVSAGHKVGNYLPQKSSLSAYHAAGVDCEACIIRHAQAGRTHGTTLVSEA